MLPARCWKRSLQRSKCSGDANGSGLPTANNYLFANLFLFKSGEGDEATSPSFAAEMRGLMLPACCWKHLLQHRKCSGDVNRSGLPTANNYLFADLLFFTDGEGDEATSPSFSAANKGNDASSVVGSAHCNKANAVGMRVGAVHPRQTTTCLAIFSFL